MEQAAIEPDDELLVVGTVEAVQDVVSDSPGGYRTSGMLKRVQLGAAGEDIRITNLTEQELQRVLALSPSFTAIGSIWIVAAAASGAFWGWRFFA